MATDRQHYNFKNEFTMVNIAILPAHESQRNSQVVGTAYFKKLRFKKLLELHRPVA